MVFQTFGAPKKPEPSKKPEELKQQPAEIVIRIDAGNYTFVGNPNEQGVQETRCDWIDYKDQDKIPKNKVIDFVSGVARKVRGDSKK